MRKGLLPWLPLTFSFGEEKNRRMEEFNWSKKIKRKMGHVNWIIGLL